MPSRTEAIQVQRDPYSRSAVRQGDVTVQFEVTGLEWQAIITSFPGISNFLNCKYTPASRLQEIAEAVEGWVRSWAVNQSPVGREPLSSAGLTAHLL